MFELNLLTILAVFPKKNLAVKISLGQLEQVFTGLFQAAFIIGVILMVIGIFLIFFPGLKTFLGKLTGI